MQSRKTDETAVQRTKSLSCILVNISIQLELELITFFIEWRSYNRSTAQRRTYKNKTVKKDKQENIFV